MAGNTQPPQPHTPDRFVPLAAVRYGRPSGHVTEAAAQAAPVVAPQPANDQVEQEVQFRDRHIGRWVTGVGAVIVAGGIALWANSQGPGEPSATTRDGIAGTTASSSPAPSKTADVKPKPSKIGRFTPMAIDCKTVATINIQQVMPMQQDIKLLGDMSTYRFNDGPTADFVTTVTGKIAMKVCMNDPAILQTNPAVKDPVGTQTYTVSLAKLPIQMDTSKLKAVPGYIDTGSIIGDLCATQTKAKATTAQAKVKQPACELLDQFKKDPNQPAVIEFTNQVQSTLKDETPAAARAAISSTLSTLDNQEAAALTAHAQAYVQNAVNTQSAEQAKTTNTLPPHITLVFADKLPAFGAAYATANKGTAASVKSRREAFMKANPKAGEAPFVIDDDTRHFTPSITVKTEEN